MNLGQWIAAKFGAQYVMLRYGRQLTFRIERAYCIGGRWYTHTYNKKCSDSKRDPDSVSIYAPPEGHAYWMLTNTTRLTKAVGIDAGTMVMSHDLWIPLTGKVDAGVSMYE